MSSRLEFRKVTVRHGFGRDVLRDFDWVVEPGITVLLGPNGAGKSTALQAAAGGLALRKGEIRYGDYSLPREVGRWRGIVGWVPQAVRPLRGLTALEHVRYAAWLKGRAWSKATAPAVEALARVGLANVQGQHCTKLSGGQLRRLGIACALVHDAEIILMDEPTAGLDPAERQRFRKLVHRLRSSVDLVITSHQIDDVARLADHIAVMRDGEICHHGGLPEFLALAPLSPDVLERLEDAYAVALGSPEDVELRRG